jgi:outer membrane protein insertion porin family/translocation and assembly module TamA
MSVGQVSRREGRAGRAALVALLVSVSWASHLAAQASDVEVTRIDFQGNESFSDEALAGAIVNQDTECRSFVLAPFCAFGLGFSLDERFLNSRQLPRDILRLQAYYSARGFREARVDTLVQRPDDDRVEIVFRVEEGRPTLIASLSVSTQEQIPSVNLGDLPIAEGDRLNSVNLDAARDTLVRRLRNNGRPHADVLRSFLIPADRPYEAEVTFEVDPGPAARFGSVTLSGNEELTDGVIRRMLPFQEGDPYSEALRLRGQRNLFNLELIQAARIADVVSTDDTVVPLNVEVTEGTLHRVRTGAGWSSSDCLNTEGSWASRNFFGGARRLQMRARLSNIASEDLTSACWQAGTGDFGGVNWLVSADFVQPWVLNQRFQLGASLFWERQSVQDVFVRSATGFDVSLSRSVDPYTTLLFYYRPELSELQAAEVFFCTSFLVCAPEDISSLQGDNWLAPIGATVVRDRTNDLLSPTRGYSVRLDYEHASGMTGSNFGYNRAFGEVAGYKSFGEGQVVAARISGGWVGSGSFGVLSTRSPVIHPQKRFYSGGANSVRGFAQNQLGPRVLTANVRNLIAEDGPCDPFEVMALTCDANSLAPGAFDPRPTGGRLMLEGSLEYRFRIAGTRVEVSTFLDFGRVWAEPGRDDPSNLELTPGWGIRYLSPIGPIRLDFGYNFQASESLQVVTSQIRPFDSALDSDSERVTTSQGDFVVVDALALLQPPVRFGEDLGFSLRRFQIHFSIGQAF